MTRSLDVLTALVAEGIKKQMTPHRRYIAASERAAIADDAAAVAIAALIDLTGGPEHVLQSEGETFSLQHPLTERLTGDLFDCTIHAALIDGGRIPRGRYRVATTDGLDLIPMKEFS